MDELEWLQNWYESQCNGDWEHGHGIKINTLDNPGWSIDINLKNTSFEELVYEEVNLDYGVRDWMVCRIIDNEFQGRGDPRKLGVIIRSFRIWVERTGPRA